MLKLAKKIECPRVTPAAEPSNKKVKNDEEITVTKGDINFFMNKFVNHKISIDGGNGDLKSAQQSRQQVTAILDTLQSRSLSSLCDRANIREKFLFTYVKEQKYAPLTIQRYLLSLIHFYDFIICEEIQIDGVSPEEILRMKVIINTLLIFFFQYRETRNACIKV